ncbi:hypothetical protein SBA5_440044 [Candidatus Sulfotelmatomonas gaucii]|uniref:Uncharacterized protein n=1 Tax=Candidatus Sulfuritelmatomonas gaucii TaxID=2043161 RepID=A0A2N9LLZ0_9BACT|nr:hypothetical protein SBA5_440044 [Candidatus Sulfotelmatomonas gaucii]
MPKPSPSLSKTIAIPESLYPEAATHKSTRPQGAGVPADRSSSVGWKAAATLHRIQEVTATQELL